MGAIHSNGKCNYDIVLGHSQGAILTAALLSMHDKLRSSSTSPKGFILNGVAWPNPYSDNMRSLATLMQKQSRPSILFVMGEADTINPIESACQVSDAFRVAGCDVSMVKHNGGHSVPYSSDDDSQRALSDVVDWIVDVIQQKQG